MREIEVPSTPATRKAISSVSSSGRNPYLELLYGSLASAGVPTGPQARLRLRWLLAHRSEVRYLHVHWPEVLYRFRRGASNLRPFVSWAKLALLAIRLRTARKLGYRLIWTVHQVYPHEATGRLDRAGARIVARHADLLVAHDPETAARAAAEFGLEANAIEVVHHGSYAGVYPPGRSSAEVRRALGISPSTLVFLCFGELRANSDISVLLQAFAQTRGGTLVIAGHAKNRVVEAAVAAAAVADNRIVRIEGFVPFKRVRELYEAANVAVVPRGDGGTSGSLILALSLGTPVVVADMPAYRRLVGEGVAGWLFRPGDATDLRAALEAAAADEAGRTARAAAARRAAAALDWSEAGARLASLLPP